MRLPISTEINGLDKALAIKYDQMCSTYRAHLTKNQVKKQYYDGHITLNEVNLGLALPDGMQKLEIGCEWGAKCVDVLASRSMFDGFVGTNGEDIDELQIITEHNRLLAEYMKACRDELKYGCTFATLSKDDHSCKIRFHSPCSATALWSGEKGRIDCGMAIIDTAYDESDKSWSPSLINIYTDDAVWIVEKISERWIATKHNHSMGIPLMVPMIFNATFAKPFGRSRINEPVRRLIQGYVRTIANATIGLEFATSPQKYLLGITDEQMDAVVNQKFKQYVGSIIASTTNPETGQNPVFGQLQQGSLEPHVQMLRMLATQFSAATGLTVTDTGVVNDANPTSSDAILAQSQTLVSLAEQLNASNGDALKQIALMALAITHGTTLEALSDDQKAVIPHFKNPSMPSVAVTADAAVKIASSRPEFASTDIFLEMVGFDQADIRRIKAQERRARGTTLLDQEFTNGIAKETEQNPVENINPDTEENVEEEQ